MFTNLFKNLSHSKFTTKSSINLPFISLRKGSNKTFSTSQTERPISTFFFGSKKKMTYAEELAELEKKFDYSHIKDNSKQILLLLLAFSAFHSVMGAPAVPQWNGQDEGRNGYGMGSEDEELYQQEHDE